MKTLWGVTHVNRDGARVLSHAAQGRHMHATKRECDAWLANAWADRRSEDAMVQAAGPQARGTFRSDPFECYDHGDPVGIYVLEDPPVIQPIRVPLSWGARHADQLRQLERAHCRTVRANRCNAAKVRAARRFVLDELARRSVANPELVVETDVLERFDEAMRSVHDEHYPRVGKQVVTIDPQALKLQGYAAEDARLVEHVYGKQDEDA